MIAHYDHTRESILRMRTFMAFVQQLLILTITCDRNKNELGELTREIQMASVLLHMAIFYVSQEFSLPSLINLLSYS